MRIIAIINQKGGCGKTTTAINLAGVLAKRGHSVLLIDTDPQSHCAAGLGVPDQKIDRHLGDAMLASDDQPIDETRLIWRVARGLDLVPSTMRLAGLEATRGGLADLPNRERRLAGVLDRLSTSAERRGRAYDVCLIDCPPSIGLLTYNALAAAKDVLIPVESSYFALQGATRQINTVRSIARKLNVRIRSRLIPTLYDPQNTLAQEVLAELRRRFPSALVPHQVRFDPVLRSAASIGRPVIDFDPFSIGALDYTRLSEWLIEHATIERGSIEDSELATHDEMSLDEAFARVDSPARLLADLRGDEFENRPDVVVTRMASGVSPRLLGDEPSVARGNEDRLSHLFARGRAAQPDDQASPQLSKLFGVRHTNHGMLFVQPLSVGNQVSIVGDFNGWNPGLDIMQRNESLRIHELCLDIEPGDRHYRLVVDGRWVTDRYNPLRSVNQFGEENNLARVLPSHGAVVA